MDFTAAFVVRDAFCGGSRAGGTPLSQRGHANAGSPWDKLPANWNLADVSRILLDSPWSPAGVKLEREHTSRHIDPETISDYIPQNQVGPAH